MTDSFDNAERRRGFLERRHAGVLLHPTSLPSGELGDDAYRFVDFLVASGFSVWQFLPLGPTHGDYGSPYQCLSAHAGNSLLISAQPLMQEGWLPAELSLATTSRAQWLSAACQGFLRMAAPQARAEYDAFTAKHAFWLDDFALFQALRRAHQNSQWIDWPQPLRDRVPAALDAARQKYSSEMQQARFEQFVFFRQWQRLKNYANSKGVLMFGDLPIFVAHDSADVWAHREQFAVDADGRLQVVAGVPPDYFSSTGQLWGNPHYNWARMAADDFHWWKQRFRSQAEMVDMLRVDHFRGFESYWEIPAGAQTAINGRWVTAPGDALFTAIRAHFPNLHIVAEDLGIITPEVTALRYRHGFPGMKILQFAFDSDAANPYLPHHHETDSVAYTGTHDNDTTLGWYNGLNAGQQQRVREYLGFPEEAMPWPLIRATLMSVAQLAVVPMQDVLALDGAHRMNTPGTVQGNWTWRFRWEQLAPDLAVRLRAMVGNYGRAV